MGMLGGNPVNYFDPDGLIRWTGKGNIKTAGKYVVAGYGWGQIDLTSECLDGKQLKVKYDVEFWPFGAGLPSEDSFDVVIEDYQSEISASNLTGDFEYKSVGVNIYGADLSYSRVNMGKGLSKSVNTTGGLSVGLSGTFIGSSKVTNDLYPYEWIDCTCEK